MVKSQEVSNRLGSVGYNPKYDPNFQRDIQVGKYTVRPMDPMGWDVMGCQKITFFVFSRFLSFFFFIMRVWCFHSFGGDGFLGPTIKGD